MTGRVIAVALVVAGVVSIALGLGGRWRSTDEGHHDGRDPTFALESTIGIDELSVEHLDGSEVQIAILRAGEPIVEFGDVHGVPLDVFVVSSDLNQFVHQALPEIEGVGTAGLTLPGPGEYRVVVQAAPRGGPDLLELGRTVVLAGEPTAADPAIAVDDVWMGEVGGSELAITRQGLDFVLSESWDGDEYRESPALLTLFRGDDLAFVHAHASTPDDDRFRFGVDLPGPGDYLGALQFIQRDEPVTALFRFQL